MKGGLLAALAAALLVLLDPGGWLAAFELRTVDARHRGHAGPSASTERIVILEIGEGTLAQLAPIYGRWPWPRSVHAEVVDYLAQDGAVAIGFDLLLAERADRRVVDARAVDTLAALAAAADVPEVRAELGAQIEALRPQRGDAELAAAAAAAGNVFAAAVLAGAPAAPGDVAQGATGRAPACRSRRRLPRRLARACAAALRRTGAGRARARPHQRAARCRWRLPPLRPAGVVARRVSARCRRSAWRSPHTCGACRWPICAAATARCGSAIWRCRCWRTAAPDPVPGRGDVYRHIPYEQVLASKDLRAAGQTDAAGARHLPRAASC